MKCSPSWSGLLKNIQTTNFHTSSPILRKRKRNSTKLFMKTKNSLKLINNSRLKKWTKRKILSMSIKVKNNIKRIKSLKILLRKNNKSSLTSVKVFFKRKDSKLFLNFVIKTKLKMKNISLHSIICFKI